jgi:hypothetical protein
MIGAAGFELLWSHVRDRAAHSIMRAGAAVRLLSGVSEQRSNSKVEHLHHPAIRNEDVFGFEIAVDDFAFVRSDKRPDHWHDQLYRLVRRESTLGRNLSEVGALQVLEHDVGHPLVLIRFVDDHDVRMLAGRGGAGFSQKVDRQRPRTRHEDLDCHPPP